MMRILGMTIAAAILAVPTLASAGDVKVDMSGVRSGGTIYVQLQTRAQFMTGARAYGEIVRSPSAGAVSLTLKDVAPGDYAVTVWHDDNGNEKFDVDPATGRPADGWSTVNAETLRGPPAFDQVKATVGDMPLTLVLPVHYGR